MISLSASPLAFWSAFRRSFYSAIAKLCFEATKEDARECLIKAALLNNCDIEYHLLPVKFEGAVEHLNSFYQNEWRK